MNDEIICKKILDDLFALRDEKYADFHAKLIPTVEKSRIIGVRTPVLRKYAKSLGVNESKVFLNRLPHEYYDEDNLHAFLLERITDYGDCVTYINTFLPFVDNWATCDMMTPKILKKYPENLKKDAFGWLNGSSVYEIRFGIKMFMDVFSDDLFSEEIPAAIAAVRSDEYYVNMMIAWYFATLLAKQPDYAFDVINSRKLPVWTHNKAISKAVESYRISLELKNRLKQLRIKE